MPCSNPGPANLWFPQFFPEIKSRLLKLLVSILIIRVVVGSNNYPQNHQILVGDWGFNSWQGKEILFFLNVRVSCVACSAPYSMDTGAQSSGVKRPEHEANHFSSVEVKSEWSCTCLPAYACVVCTGSTLRLPKRYFL